MVAATREISQKAKGQKQIKYYQLDPTEKQILDDFNHDQFVEVTEDQENTSNTPPQL